MPVEITAHLVGLGDVPVVYHLEIEVVASKRKGPSHGPYEAAIHGGDTPLVEGMRVELRFPTLLVPPTCTLDRVQGIEARCGFLYPAPPPPMGRFAPGFRGVGSIVMQVHRGVVVVPADMLRRDDRGVHGFVLDRSSHPPCVHRREIQAVEPEAFGPENGLRRVEVTSGLAAGESIVRDASGVLQDGTVVTEVNPDRLTGAAMPCNRVRFLVQGSEVVDGRSGLRWLREDAPGEMNHDAAEAWCARAGMRLPTYAEVAVLAGEEQRADTCAFPALQDGYWTASEGEYTGTFWTVNFVCGCSPSAFGRQALSHVRCVGGSDAERETRRKHGRSCAETLTGNR